MAGNELRVPDGPAAFLRELRNEMNEHPIWGSRLLRACERGHLTRSDFAFLFSQYYLYSSNFTRYLANLLGSCESDLHRSKLSQNLWEESGALEPSQRHSALFRDFLRSGLGIEVEAIEFTSGARHFVDTYLTYSRKASAPAAAAFLALGTEGTVSRLYSIFVKGLRRAGVAEASLRFFQIHIDCDDEHAATLEEIVAHHVGTVESRARAREGMLMALDARKQFFDDLYQSVQTRRVFDTLRAIDGRESMCPSMPRAAEIVFPPTLRTVPLYANRIASHDIDFEVHRIPMAGDVLDARLVRIPAGRRNELHKHAHESIFHIVRGSGIVHVNDAALPVGAGDVVFVPRWAMHQTENTDVGEMVILAITDHKLTGRALIGNYDETARLRSAGNP